MVPNTIHLRKERRGKIPKRFESHDFGMVGFIKQLIDEAGMDSIHDLSHQTSKRQTMIEKMEINAGFAMIKKM